MQYRVALVKWGIHDGIATSIGKELIHLGHEPIYFLSDDPIPRNVDVVLCFGPYGRFVQIPQQLEGVPHQIRPVFVQWATQNPPDLRIPWAISYTIGAVRSWLGRNSYTSRGWLDLKMHKFRYLGDDVIAYQRGWIDLLCWTSKVYTAFYSQHGIPAKWVPYGTYRDCYASRNLHRDIDVLWFGKRRTRRRSRLLDFIREELALHGIQMYVADDQENPFIYGERRIELLNRAKITLNLLPTWYDQAFGARFHLAAPNRSLVISEPVLPHCPQYEAGKHYVSAPVDQIADTIRDYLAHEYERSRIVEDAYELATQIMPLEASIRMIFDQVDKVVQAKQMDVRIIND